MGECEICGKGEGEFIVLIESARMRVCRNCSMLGKLLAAPQIPRHEKPAQEIPYAFREEIELVDDYGDRIRKGRERLGLPLAVLAERINEKESFLEHVEHEKAKPDEALCRKIEKELGIRLLEAVASTSSQAKAGQSGPVTLGDIIEIQKKDRKK